MTSSRPIADEVLIGPGEAARLIGCHVRSVIRWSEQGVIPVAVRTGPRKDRRFRLADVQTFIDEHIDRAQATA